MVFSAPRSASWAALGAGLLVAVSTAGAEPACRAWPGEPEPLATTTASAPAQARWARLRADELRLVALRVRESDPRAADRLLRHASCLAPDDEALRDAARRELAVAVYRPSLLALAAPRAATSRGIEATLAGLARVQRAPAATPPQEPAPEPPPAAPTVPAETAPAPPVAVAVLEPEFAPEPELVPRPVAEPEPEPEPPPAVSAPPPPRPAPVRAAPEPVVPAAPTAPVAAPVLADAESALRAARFEDAIEVASDGLAELGGSAAPRSELARLAVIEGTAQLALGRDAAARASFRLARSLDPELELDPLHHSPKVRDAWRAAEEPES